MADEEVEGQAMAASIIALLAVVALGDDGRPLEVSGARDAVAHHAGLGGVAVRRVEALGDRAAMVAAHSEMGAGEGVTRVAIHLVEGVDKIDDLEKSENSRKIRRKSIRPLKFAFGRPRPTGTATGPT